MRLPVRGSLRRAEILELVGREIEPIDVAAVGILDPHLVVDRRAFDREMAELAGVGVPLLRRRPLFEFLRLAVELGDRALIHHADPRIVVLVDFEIERAERVAGLDDRDRILRDLAGLRVHLAEEHLAEIRVPDGALVIEHDIVRLDQLIRQVVLGDDDVGRFAGEPRQRLERPAPRVLLAQIDAGEPLGGLLRLRPFADVASGVAGERLRLAAACCPDSSGPCA